MAILLSKHVEGYKLMYDFIYVLGASVGTVKCLNGMKWSVEQCSKVEWSVVGLSLNGKKWSVDKFSEVEWCVFWWSLNGKKWSVDMCSEVDWSVVGGSIVKFSEV
jgi:hypothetical protein